MPIKIETQIEALPEITPIKKPRAVRNKKTNEKIERIDKFFDKNIAPADKSVGTVVSPDKTKEAVSENPRVIFLNTKFGEKKSLFDVFNKKVLLISLLVLFVLTLMGISGYFYYQYRKISATEVGKNEAADYTAKIGEFMILPADEVPTVATVADKEKLAGQPFFAKAENGDKVLFYTKSQKAILYRPSSNMIIEATAMSIGAQTGNVQAPIVESDIVESEVAKTEVQASAVDEEKNKTEVVAEVEKRATVFVENGTSKKGLAKTMAEKIAQISGVTVAGTGNTKGNFEKTIVVDFSGKSAALASEIAKSLEGEVGELPNGESKPEADILVIIGIE